MLLRTSKTGLMLLAICLFSVYLFSQSVGLLPGVGREDFVEYWTAHKIASSGADPYNPDLMLEAQREINPAAREPLMMWNPPWTLLFMSPLLRFDFNSATILWTNISFVMMLVSGALVFLSFPPDNKATITSNLVILISGCCSMPFLASLKIGQLSALLTLGAALAFLGVARKNQFATAIGFVLMSLKAHLFLFFCGFLFFAETERKKLTIWLIVVGCLILGATQCIFPHTLVSFFESMDAKSFSAKYVKPEQWRTSTIVSLLRDSFPNVFNPFMRELFLCLSSISLISGALLGIRYRGRVGPLELCSALCLSTLLAPFGWLFDFSVLNLVSLGLLHHTLRVSSRPNYSLILTATLAVQLIALLVLTKLGDYAYFFWYPWAIAAIVWLACYLVSKRQTGGEPT